MHPLEHNQGIPQEENGPETMGRRDRGIWKMLKLLLFHFW